MNKKIVFIVIFILVSQFLIQEFFLGFENIAESSVFSLNLYNFFIDFLSKKSIFFNGSYNVNLISYIPVYLGMYIFSFLIGGNGYIGFLVFAICIGVIGMFKLISFLTYGKFDNYITGVLVLLFFSSLSCYGYLQNTFMFLLPFCFLPIYIYLSLQFIKGTTHYGFILLILNFFVITNLTHYIIFHIINNIFILGIYSHKNYFNSFFRINILIIPSFIYILTGIIISSLYLGDVSSIGNLFIENFYSNNTSIYNILIQQTDWGLFGSRGGKLYYYYSVFYMKKWIAVFGLMPLLILIISYLTGNRGPSKKLLNILGVSIILIIFFMLGNTNFIYKWLYDNIFIFQVFRNITKWAPALYFIIIIIIAILSVDLKKKIYLYILVTCSLLIGLIYNIPFWTFNNLFFQDRNTHIPDYWYKMSDYINTNYHNNNKILTLPATYINESYIRSGKYTAVQGSLLDSLSEINSFRLSEILIGSPQYQLDVNKLFIGSNRSIRGRDINYDALTKHVKKYNLDSILLTNDLKSEYQYIGDIYKRLSKAGYTLVKKEGFLELYTNITNYKSLFLYSIFFKKNNNGNYSLTLTISRSTTGEDLKFLQSFHPERKLFPGKPYTCDGETITYSGSAAPGHDLTPITYTAVTGDNRRRIANKNAIDLDILESYNTGVKAVFPVGQKFVVGFDESSAMNESYDTTTECITSGYTFFEGEELSYLWKTPLRDESHSLVNEYANGREIDLQKHVTSSKKQENTITYLQKGLEEGRIHKNPDGSYQVDLVLYFHPQSWFYLGLIISGLTLLSLLGWLILHRKRSPSFIKEE